MNIPPALRHLLPGLFTLPWIINAPAQDVLRFPLAQSLITVESTPPPLGETPPKPSPSPSPSPASLQPAAPPPAGSLLLNFQGASLGDVLAYLSEAAGFVIVQEAPVAGTVNIVSKQPITAEEAVDLLNSVLAEKGYVAIRNGRILKIVSRTGSQKRDLPVATGADPARIPRNDEVVTQILPLRFGEAGKLVENLRPLLADTATISANEGSNAILLTDTQANIRRIAMIIHALDTSVSSIATLRVFPLSYADAKSLADIVTNLFATPENNSNPPQNQNGGGRRFGGGGGRGGFGGPSQPDPAAAKSGALEAAARVVAVADEQSNSLIVSASEDVIREVGELVAKVDRSTTDITDTRVFRLINADAVETADLINALYGDGTTNSSSSTAQAGGQNRNGAGRNGGGNGNRNGGGNIPGLPPQFAALLGNNGARSERALAQARVVAVGDPRTNSLLVSASRDSIAAIAEMVGRLDATDAKKQHVYIYPLQHADPDSVANVLRGMTGDSTAAGNAASGVSRLTDRAANGASTEATQSATSSSSLGRSSR